MPTKSKTNFKNTEKTLENIKANVNSSNSEDNQTFVSLSEATFLDNTRVIPRINLYLCAGKNWIPWSDMCTSEMVNYPDKLIRLYKTSALHKAICDNTAFQIAGKGFTWDKTSPTNDKTSQFLANINNDLQDINEILSRVSLDLKIFGGFALLVTWSRDWTEIIEIEHVEINKLRAAKPDLITGKIPGYWFSFDWGLTYRPLRYFIPVFDPTLQNANKKRYQQAIDNFWYSNSGVKDTSILDGKENTQIIYYKEHSPDSWFYPNPDYSGCITSLDADIESDNYMLSSLKNSLSLEYIINIITKETKEGKQQIVKQLLDSFKGAKNAGLPLISFSKDKDNIVQVTKLDAPDQDKRYTNFNMNALQKILFAHKINPVLAGLLLPGSLGNLSGNIESAQELFNITVVEPYQQKIAKVFNKIMKINGLDQLSIIPIDPINTIAPTTKTPVNNEVDNPSSSSNAYQTNTNTNNQQ